MPSRILVVDDHEPVRRRIRALLEHEGLIVCAEAANGREAIDRTRDCSPDLAILNLSMPLMNGLQALPEMLKCAPQMKIVLFTVDDSEELKRQAFRLGARGYVTKSEPQALLAEVKRLLG